LTIIQYHDTELKEYSIKGEVYTTLVLEGDNYSLEDDLAEYKKTFCKDGV
jgi:hypothetical protein